MADGGAKIPASVEVDNVDLATTSGERACRASVAVGVALAAIGPAPDGNAAAEEEEEEEVCAVELDGVFAARV